MGSSEASCAALADGLAQNGSLTKVDLRNNKLGPGSGKALADCVRRNRTLQELDLRFNSMGRYGATCLLEAMEHNIAICSLELSANEVPFQVMGDIGVSRIFFPLVSVHFVGGLFFCCLSLPL